MAEASHVSPHTDANPFIESSWSSADDSLDDLHQDDFTRKQAWCLYLSHFLSMWNSRSYEHAVVLFIQAAFPGTLLASSINGVAETICVLLFSSALGRWVDRAPSRLRTLLLTINIDKCMVLICSVLWFLILSSESLSYKRILFAIALVLGMVEKLSRMTNTLSMERDWIPTLANPSFEGKSWQPYGLTQLNTTIRRIDMICKIGSPLVILEFLSYVGTHKAAVVVIAVVSTVSWAVECWAATKIWRGNHRLQAPKKGESDDLEMEELDTEPESQKYPEKPLMPQSILDRSLAYVKASVHTHMDGLRYYFSTDVCIPSICIAILHASVLSYGGTFTTYLLNAGLIYDSLTYAKAVGSVFEIGSTVLFPYAVAWLSFPANRTQVDPDDMHGPKTVEVREHLLESSSDVEEATQVIRRPQTPYLDSGIVRVGLWGICGLFICLIPAMFSVFSLDAVLPPPPENPNAPPLPSLMSTHIFLMLTLFLFLSISFLGRWTYDLSTMQLTQVIIPPTHRSNFGGTEMAVVSVFSMIHWVSALIWNRQSDFKWLAVGSFVGVGFATVIYWGWSRWWEKEGRVQGQRRDEVTWADT